METCYEYLGCNQKNCICYQLGMRIPCWKVENTLCHHDGIQVLRNKSNGSKKDVCCRKGCIYYKKIMSEKSLWSVVSNY